MNSYISLNQEMGEEGTDTFLDLLESFDNANPEQLVIDLESTQAIREQMEHGLSSLELQVLRLYLQGMNYRQIAVRLCRDAKAIDNALQRIRGKLQKIRKKG